VLDRIDIQVSVPSVRLEDCHGRPAGEGSAQIRERVARAHKVQQERLLRLGVHVAQLQGKKVIEILEWNESAERFSLRAADKLEMSHRGYYRMLRVARTIADLRGSLSVETPDIAESIQYRNLEKSWKL
jgi:magnesium chelatase family protein